MKEDFNVFLLKLNTKLHRVGEGKMNVTITNPFTVINASPITDTPCWIIVISIICGILLLILVIFILYKLGFFKRAKKEEIKTFRRESRRMTLRIQEAALLGEEDGEELLEDKAVADNCNEMVKQLKATQKLKNLAEEENVPYQSQPSTSRKRASFKTVNSITLDANKIHE